MILFSKFDATAWQEAGQDTDVRFLIAPDGSQVSARPDVAHLCGEDSIARTRWTRLVPFWLLHAGDHPLGRVFKRSRSPLLDIQHALGHPDTRARIEARLETCALALDLQPGDWDLSVNYHMVIPRLGGDAVPLKGMPNQLTDMIAHARVQTYDDDGREFLESADAGFRITVPSSRHGMMERLHALNTLAGQVEMS